MNDTSKGKELVRPSVQVFVYGTLTDPERVATLLEDGPGEYAFDGAATLEGLQRVDGRYPTLVPGGSVDGRLLSVDDAALECLDRYEGVDSGLYVRVAVADADDGPIWTYVGDPDRLGVESDTAWPDDRPFPASVRSCLASHSTVVRTHE